MKKAGLIFGVMLIIGLAFSTILMAGTYSGGDGLSVGTAFQISDKADLLELCQTSGDWSEYFKQTANINFVDSDFESDGDFYNSGKGFSPIGNITTTFTGSYDGQNHTIDGLYISRPSENRQGFFGFLDGATITNLGVTSVDVTGKQNVGGLIGNCASSSVITNCFSTGDVTGASSFVGGLAGSATSSSVSDCYSMGSVTGQSNYAGGLIGSIQTSCTVENSYSTASVEAPYYAGGFSAYIYNSTVYNCYSSGSVSGTESCIGGFTGYLLNDSSYKISKCYSTGSVSGWSNTGGFVGSNAGYTIENCYSRGSVNGGYAPGGFCGRNNSVIQYCYSTGLVTWGSNTNRGFLGTNSSGTYTNNFFDRETSGQTSDLAGAATAKTTTEMKTLATFTDVSTVGLTTAWDFVTNPNNDTGDNDYWDMDYSEVTNNGYPYLSWEDGEDVSLPVELSSFTATAGDKQVTLKWTTESEVDNLGFNIYRSLFENKDYQQITSELIPGAGNSAYRNEYEYVDKGLTNGVTYWYKLEDVDYDGLKTEHGPVSATPQAKVEVVAALPDAYALSLWYPNPFNPITTIQYQLPEPGYVRLVIYDILGQEVRRLVSKTQPAGWYRVSWDGTDKLGKAAASGTYLCQMVAGDFIEVRRMCLIR